MLAVIEQKGIKVKDILNVNAHLKYVEFLLSAFDRRSDYMTLGELRLEFKSRFQTLQPLLNKSFGIYRLLQLILMKGEYKNLGIKLEGGINKIKIILDSIDHNKFLIDEMSYTLFKKRRGKIFLRGI